MNAHPDRATTEKLIRTAFAGVTLGNGISLRQAQVIDRYGEDVTDAEFDALPRQEVTSDGLVSLLRNLSAIASLTASELGSRRVRREAESFSNSSTQVFCSIQLADTFLRELRAPYRSFCDFA